MKSVNLRTPNVSHPSIANDGDKSSLIGHTNDLNAKYSDSSPKSPNFKRNLIDHEGHNGLT